MMYRVLCFLLCVCFSIPLMASDDSAPKNDEKSSSKGDNDNALSKNSLEKTAESFLGKVTGGLGDGESKGKGEDLLGDFKNKEDKSSGKHNLLSGVGNLVSEDGKPNVKGILEVLNPKHSEGKKHYSFEDTANSASDAPPNPKHKNHQKKHKDNNEDTTEGVKKNN